MKLQPKNYRQVDLGWFKAGDLISIRGNTFRIKSVKPDELRLKVVKQESKNVGRKEKD